MAKTPNAPTNMSVLFTRRRFFETTLTPAPAVLSAAGRFMALVSSDNLAPSVPLNIAANAVSSSRIDVSWSASTDTGGSGLAGYRGFRDGSSTPLFATSSTSYSDTGLTQATQYSYRVLAYDNQGNESALSASAAATTQSDVQTGAPFILFVGNTAGPRTGGEGGNGTYVFIYLMNAGTFADYGVTNFVTIGGVNVSGYCSLFDPQNPKLVALGVKCLAVQVGALTGLSDGTAYPISVTVNGAGPTNPLSGGSYRDVFGEAFTFTPQPGSIFFVNPVTGDNANAGTFASPYRDLQSSNGAGGAMKVHTSDTGADGNGIKPGSHVVLRGGTYTAVGLFNRWCAVFRITGTPATGAANRGPICIMSYPGAPGSNAPELAFWDAPAGAGGGFNGNDTTRANVTPTAYSSQIGWAKNIEITRLKIKSSPTSGGDGGPINCQNRAREWRAIDCDLTWPHTSTNPQGRSGGVEGSPINGRFYGLYIHDIYGVFQNESNTQHGFYFDGYGSGTGASGAVASGNIAAYCYIRDITFGNGIQFYDGTNGAGMDNNTVAYNWIKTVQKHGLNIADNTRSCTAYNNIIEDSGEAGIRISTSALTGANGINIFNNVVYGWSRITLPGGSIRPAIYSESTFSGSMRIENNIFMQTPAHAANGYYFYSTAGSSITVTKNRWYDPDGRLTTKPSQDSTGSYGNPGFTSASTGDFTLTTGSACIDSGNTPSVTPRSYGFVLNSAPQGATHDIGPYER